MNNKVKFLRGTSDEYAVAVKDDDADFVFQVVDGRCKRWLRNKQVLGCLVEGADLCDADGVTKLLESHGKLVVNSY